VRLVVAPAAIEPIVHGNPPAHGALAETNVTPAGGASDTTTPDASDGPLFFTAIVYATALPGVTLAGPVLVTCRSALGTTGVMTELLLFAEFGSLVVNVTFAVFVMDAAANAAGMLYVTVTVVLAPSVMLPIVHGKPPAHGAVADTKVRPAGGGSSR
jgi:hypothetical protein